MTTLPSLSTANSARARARRYRASALLAIADDNNRTTVNDILRHACTEKGRPLLRLTLKQLLLAQPGVGDETVTRILNHTVRVVGVASPPRRLTVAWLLDARAGGRRFMAFCDALADNSKQPWPGFPFMPRPQKTTGRTSQ